MYTLVIRDDDIRPPAEELVDFFQLNGDVIKAVHINFVGNDEVTRPISDIELEAIDSIAFKALQGLHQFNASR